MTDNASELPFAQSLKEDLEYMFYLHALVTQFARLKKYEQKLVLSFTEWKDNGKLFSPKQRSAIGNLYTQYLMEK